MIELQRFFKLVNDCTDNVSSIRNDFPALYRHVGLPSESSCSLNAVTDALLGKVRSALGSLDKKAVDRHMRQLLDEIILHHVLNDVQLQPYARLLEIMRDAMRYEDAKDQIAPSADWGTAVQAAVDYRVFREGISDEMFPQFYSRQFAVARAARWFRDRGYTVLVEKNQVSLDSDSETRLTNRLSNLAREIGGINVVGKILRHLGQLYDQVQQRYHLVRRVSTMPGQTKPAVPWGYLIQLATKHPFLRTNPLFAAQNWRDLIELSTRYATLHDVQPHSVYESIFKDSHTLLRSLQELAVFDSLFTLHQIKPAHAIAILRGILTPAQREQIIANVASVNEVIMVAEQMLTMGQDSRMPFCFDWRDLAQHCSSIPPSKVADIFEKVLSHPAVGANNGYASPTSENMPDFIFRPCLRLRRDNYCLLAPALCARGVMEAVLIPLRDSDGQFDGNLGFAIERFIRRTFAAIGIATRSGKYLQQSKTMECDLIIETEDTIILLEVKKKPLTRKASTGSDISLLLDLAGSLLEAQLQAGNHELLLRQQGFLELEEEDGTTRRLEHRGRHIERIAVTLFDFGSFQDRMMLEQFLRISSNLQFQPIEPAHAKKFKELNASILKLRQQVGDLASLSPQAQRKPFFHCWFLSVPQLLILVENCHNPEDFKTELWRTRHSSTGSLDFYFDYFIRRNQGV